MRKFLKVAMLPVCLVCLSACGGDNDEPQPARKITVQTYESSAPKGNEFYNPQSWSYCTTMLFSCQPTDMDKVASTASLANAKAILTNGQTLGASYTSDTGVIDNANYGSYTLVVYCNGNPLNGYLENRWTSRPFNYSERNSNASLSCCFVWEDMLTNAGWQSWQDM